jgi:hypothetical protein
MQMVGLSQLGWQEHVCTWHLADKRVLARNGRYWTKSGQRLALRRDSSVANDPSATSAVRCGKGFDAGFSPYQSARLSR